MSKLTPSGPVLHLPMTRLDGDAVRDRSGNALDATVRGGVRLIPDDRFGTALRFDGTGSLKVAYNPLLQFGAQDFTVSLWVRVRQAQANSQQDYVSLVEVWDGLTGGFPYALRLTTADDAAQAMRYDQASVDAVLTSAGLGRGQFHHVALVRSGGTLRLFLDGTASGDAVKDSTGANTVNSAALTVAMNSNDDGARANPFTGDLAHLRVYSRAQSLAEIRRDILNDTTEAAAFSGGSPVDFRLCDAAGLAVLCVDDGTGGQALSLNVGNTSGQALAWPAPASPLPSAQNCHLSLWFRPGTLSEAALLGAACTSPGWSLSAPQVLSGGVVALYLLAPGGAQLAADDGLAIGLSGLSAAAGGNRVTQVELGYQQLTYADADATPIAGTRSTVLTVANPAGSGREPLALSFASRPYVTNDGVTATTLTLRLANLSQTSPVRLRGPESDAPSRLALRFDSGDDFTQAPYALSTPTLLRSATVTCGGFDVACSDGSGPPTWTLTPTDDRVLGPGESLLVTIAGILSAAPSGQSYAYVAHQGIPGYADGQAVGLVEKGQAAPSRDTQSTQSATIGSWTIQQSDDNLVLVWGDQTRVTFTTAGDVVEQAGTLVRYGNDLMLTKIHKTVSKGSATGAATTVYLSGTTSQGDSDHQNINFKEWGYWSSSPNTTTGYSDYLTCKLQLTKA